MLRPRLARVALGLGALLISPAALQGQCETSPLGPPAAGGAQAFGTALAASGTRTLVGPESGAVFLFETDDASPVTLRRPSDTSPDDGFGTSVALDGTWAAVGAPRDDGAGPDAGAVHLYTRRTDGWQHVLSLRPRGEGLVDEGFGTSLALQGDTLLVGRPGDDSGGDDRGAVEVFERLAVGWRLTGKLTEDGGTTPYLGTSVALDGDRAVVGARGDASGAAFLFERDVEGYWGQVARLETDVLPTPDIDFAASVALRGDVAVVGAPRWTSRAGEPSSAPRSRTNADAEGALFVFAFVDELWTLVDRLEAPAVVPDAPVRGLGRSVSMLSDAIAAGAPDGPRGGLQLFERRDADSPYLPTARMLDEPLAPTRFGSALALLSDRLVVGAPDALGGGTARVFASTWSRPVVTGLGLARPGADGSPCLCARADDDAVRVDLTGPPSSAGMLVLGARTAWTTFAGGVLVPSPDVLVPIVLGARGRLAFSVRLATLGDASVVAQGWFVDDDVPAGFASSNALRIALD